MSIEDTIGGILETINARMLAVDAGDKQSIAELGMAVEKAAQTAESLPEQMEQCFSLLLSALQAVYQETVTDGQAIVDAIAVVIGAAAEVAGCEDDSPPIDDMRHACEALRELLDADEDAPGQPKAVAETSVSATPPTPPYEKSSGGEFPQAADSLPADADMELMGEFRVECVDHISAAEAALLDLENDPGDVEQINTIFRAFHTIKGTSGFLGLDRIQRLAHLAENLLDRARDGKVVMTGGYADLTLKSCDSLRTMIEGLDGIEPGEALLIPEAYAELIGQLANPEEAGFSDEAVVDEMRLGDILVGQGQIERDVVESAADEQADHPIGQTLVNAGAAKACEVASALRIQKKISGKSAEGTVRVATGRLDGLINMVGELVISHSMVAQDPDLVAGANARLARNVSRAGKIIRELQDLTMSLRMVPLKGTFQKMARLARDLSRKAGKQVSFMTDGADTEIDRSMVEVLNDPLVHMMRNALDHGIETADKRRANGKNPVGTVRLQAYHSAGNVVIQLQDDGNGLDRDRIIAKAVSRGVIDPDRDLTDSEVFALIFQPGFSTAAKVTDISGRGVGMDVVKRGIESLRGRVEVSSVKGGGTTFTVRVPLTMAIVNAMLLRVGEQRFLLPTASIEQAFRPEASALSSVAGRGEMVMIRGNLLPVFRLNELFSISGAVTDPITGLLVIIEGEGRRCALMVDDLVSQQQVVVKSLGQSLGTIAGISGGAILGDGQVGLILDASGLLKLAGGKSEAVAA